MNLPTISEVRAFAQTACQNPVKDRLSFQQLYEVFGVESAKDRARFRRKLRGHGAAWRAGPGGARALQVQPQRPGPGSGRGLPAHLAGHQGPAAGLDHARPGPGHPHKLLPRPHVLPMAEPRGLHNPPRPPRHVHPVAGHGQGQGTADRADSDQDPPQTPSMRNVTRPAGWCAASWQPIPTRHTSVKKSLTKHKPFCAGSRRPEGGDQ